VKDMQPFAIVSDEGFREFVAALDPSYTLPNVMSSCDATRARELVTSSGNVSAMTVNEDDDLTWGDFECRQSSVLVTPSSSAMVEVRQYIATCTSVAMKIHLRGGRGGRACTRA